MALKNRNQNIAGRFRVSVVCPACGWTGVGMFEITRTTSPPSKKYADAALPPEVDAEFLAEPANIDGQLF